MSQTTLIYRKFLLCFPLYWKSTCKSLGGPCSAQTSSHGMPGHLLANPLKALGTDMLFVERFIDSWFMCLHWQKEDPGTHVPQELQVTVPFPAPPDPLADTLGAHVSSLLPLMFSLRPHKIIAPPHPPSGSGMLAINTTRRKKIMAMILHGNGSPLWANHHQMSSGSNALSQTCSAPDLLTEPTQSILEPLTLKPWQVFFLIDCFSSSVA